MTHILCPGYYWVIAHQKNTKKKSIRIKETVKSGKIWTGRFNYGKYYICRVETQRERKKIAALVSFIWSEVPANWLLLQRVAGVKWAADTHRLIY